MKHTQLAAAFAGVNGASFVGIDTLTEVTLRGGKDNPHQGRITKRMVGARVMVFQNKTVNGYEAMVQRRLLQEGKDPASFELQPRKWGTRIPNMPIVEHEKDGCVNYYLEVIFLAAGEVEYKCDGLPIAKDDILGLIECVPAPDSQGGLDNKVIVRSFKADSITEVRIDGRAFQ